jgi:hypothetical protein
VLFGGVERPVGASHQRFRCCGVRREHRDTDARGDRAVDAFDSKLTDALPDLLRDTDCVAVIGVGEEEDEFLTAAPSREVAFPQLDPQERGECGQSVIPRSCP